MPLKAKIAISGVLLLFAVLLFLFFPQQDREKPPEPPDLSGFIRVDHKDLPSELREWVDNSREVDVAQEKEYQGKRYLLLTYGEQPTGGYSVEIEELIPREEKIEVKVRYERPQPGEFVTQAITYPFDIVYTEPSELPLEFTPRGDEDYIKSLIGIDQIPPIVASSDFIKIFSPAPEEEVGREFSLEGIATVFEGNILYRILNADGEEIYKDFTTAGMGDWYYFETGLDIPPGIDRGEDFALEIYTRSAKDGSVENRIKIPLSLSP